MLRKFFYAVGLVALLFTSCEDTDSVLDMIDPTNFDGSAIIGTWVYNYEEGDTIYSDTITFNKYYIMQQVTHDIIVGKDTVVSETKGGYKYLENTHILNIWKTEEPTKIRTFGVSKLTIQELTLLKWKDTDDIFKKPADVVFNYRRTLD